MAQFERFIRALQRGLGPVAIGLMSATTFLLMRDTPGGVWKGGAIIVASLLLLSLTRLPAVLVILGAGVLGAFIPW
jgi:chromate transport protein ChrA